MIDDPLVVTEFVVMGLMALRFLDFSVLAYRCLFLLFSFVMYSVVCTVLCFPCIPKIGDTQLHIATHRDLGDRD